jgi:hypothetical protein
MRSHFDGLEDIQNRLLKLERQNRRLKQFGVAVLAASTSLILMAQAPSKKIIEANEFILRDDSGNVRAKLSMTVPAGAAPGFPAVAQLILFDEKGKKRVAMNGGTSIETLGLVQRDHGVESLDLRCSMKMSAHEVILRKPTRRTSVLRCSCWTPTGRVK